MVYLTLFGDSLHGFHIENVTSVFTRAEKLEEWFRRVNQNNLIDILKNGYWESYDCRRDISVNLRRITDL